MLPNGSPRKHIRTGWAAACGRFPHGPAVAPTDGRAAVHRLTAKTCPAGFARDWRHRTSRLADPHLDVARRLAESRFESAECAEHRLKRAHQTHVTGAVRGRP